MWHRAELANKAQAPDGGIRPWFYIERHWPAAGDAHRSA